MTSLYQAAAIAAAPPSKPILNSASNPHNGAPSDQLYWIQLTPTQRHALAPLMPQWEGMNSLEKRKWIAFADRYLKMTPTEQANAQARMKEWLQLTPDQRNVARDSYLRTQALSPAKRAELLARYRALPEEQKKQLAEQGKGPKKLILHKATTEAVPTHAQIREGVNRHMSAATKNASVQAAPTTTSAKPLTAKNSQPAGPSSTPPASKP